MTLFFEGPDHISTFPVHPEPLPPRIERIDEHRAFICADERPKLCEAGPRHWLRIRPSPREKAKDWGLQLLSGLTTIHQVVTFEVVLLRSERGPQTLLYLTAAGEDEIKLQAALTMALTKSEVRRVKDPIRQFLAARKRERKGTYQVRFFELVTSGQLWDPLRSSRPGLIDDVCRCVHLLGDDELAFVQVLFGATSRPWETYLEEFLAVRDPIFNEFGEDSGKVAHPIYTDQELKAFDRALREKLKSRSQLAFSALFRVGHVSPLGRGETALEGLCTPLESLSHGWSALKKVPHTWYPEGQRREMVYNRAVFRHGILATPEELAQAIALPSEGVLYDSDLGADKVKNTAPAPRSFTVGDGAANAGGIRLGVNVHRGTKNPVIWADQRSNPHLAVIGRTGTGKTNFLRVLISQILEDENAGLAVFDPLGGNLSEEALQLVPRSRWDQTLYIDAPSFPERPIPFNYLDLGRAGGRGLLKETIRNDLLDILEEQLDSQSLGVQIKETLLSTVALLMENPGSTIADIPRVLQDPGFRAELLDAPTVHELVRQFWARYKDTSRISPVTNKMVEFLLSDVIRPIISQRECGIDFQQAFENGDIFIFNLAKSRIGGDRTAKLLGKLFLSRFTSAAFTRPKHAKDYYLLLDESQYLVTDSLKALLSGARQFSVHLVVVTQTTADLPTEFRQHLITNASKVSFAVTDNKVDSQFLSCMAPWFTPRDIQMLGVGEAVCRLGEKQAFSMQVDFMDEQRAAEAAEYIKNRSREIFSCPEDENEIGTEQCSSTGCSQGQGSKQSEFVPKFSWPASSTRESEQK